LLDSKIVTQYTLDCVKIPKNMNFFFGLARVRYTFASINFFVLRSEHALLVLLLFLFSCKSNTTQNTESETESPDQASIQITPTIKLSELEINNYTQQLSLLFDSNLNNKNFNGGIIVAKGGNILYEKYTGYTNPKNKNTPITDTTSFHLASTSKPFTGMAILKLVQQGNINLNDEVLIYFPTFPYPGITIKDLLSHRSGLPNYLYFMEDRTKWPNGKMVSNQDVLNFMIQYRPALNYTPGTRFNYCNTNYVLLALIIEKVSGESYPNFLDKTIFKPLGMVHSFVYTTNDSGRVLMSYKPSGAIWEDDIFDNTYGDKNIYSTPRDMVKWDAALYNNFINPTLLDSAYQPLSNESHSTHNYGLGWRMLNLSNGKKVIYHNGKWHGFTPAFARLIDEKAVIIILGNQMNKNIYSAAKKAYNVFGNYLQSDSSEEDDNSPHQTIAPPVLSKKVEPYKTDRKEVPNKNKLKATSKTPIKKSTPKKNEKKTTEKTQKKAKTLVKIPAKKKTMVDPKTSKSKKDKK